jgi:hypothetical protein
MVAHQQREVARPSQSSRCNDVFASYLHVNEANEGKLKYVRILRLGIGGDQKKVEIRDELLYTPRTTC